VDSLIPYSPASPLYIPPPPFVTDDEPVEEDFMEDVKYSKYKEKHSKLLQLQNEREAEFKIMTDEFEKTKKKILKMKRIK